MQLAVLGTDSDILALIAAAVADGHEIIWLGEVRPEDVDALRTLAPNVAGRPAGDWETLLDHATADAVLVGRAAASEELRSEQLKRLATDAVTMLIVHPAVESVLIYYEVDMLRRETGGIVRHYNPLLSDPRIAELAAWARDGHELTGPVHQVTCQRRLSDGTRGTVMRALARDAELLAMVGGDIRQVSAVGPRDEEASYASLQVQMTTLGPATLRWSAAPPSANGSGVELTLVGERGVITATTSDGAGSWHIEIAGKDERTTLQPIDHRPAGNAIRQCEAALKSAEGSSPGDRSTWERATQSMEVIDAVQLSLQKGKTIEVHQQHLTEQLAFRGTMAALGCGLLLLGFVVVVAAGVLGGVEAVLEQRLMRPWPIILLAVLAFFLLLQTVPFLASKPRKRGTATTKTPGADRP